MTYDAARAEVVLFGGVDDLYYSYDDTWKYDGTSWSPGPAAPPGLTARASAALAYDPGRGRVVLFGGADEFGAHKNDTWEYDGVGWSAGPAAPPGLTGRWMHALAYHSGTGRIALFGGQALGGARLNDTWEYDGLGWAPGPPAPLALLPRSDHAMAGDTDRGRVVLFGGYDSTNSRLDDTWEYDGTAWVPAAPAPVGLEPSAGHAMAYDGTRGRTVLLGADEQGSVWEYACPPVQLSPTSLPPGYPGVPYTRQLSAAGGTPPYTFSVSSGSLPPGLSLTPGGLLSGTPTTAGLYMVVIAATDGFVCSGSHAYLLAVNCPGMSLEPQTLPAATVGAPYSATFTVTGGAPPYTYSVTVGSLPSGLNLSSSGVLSGTPTASGTFAFGVTATDAFSCEASRGYSLDVAALASYLVGQGHGQPNPNGVRIFSATGTGPAVDFLAYGAGSWGTNVGSAQLDGGSYDDILTGPGPGAVFGPQVRGFDRSGAGMSNVSFYAYGTLRYGVNAGGARVDADIYDEIVSGAGPGAVFGPHVRGWDFDGASVAPIPSLSYFAYATLRFGVLARGGDVDGDAFEEILTGPGPGPTFGPQARGWNFDGSSIRPMSGINFMAFAASGYGVRVSAGDVDADTFAELACARGFGPGVPSDIRGFNYDGVSVSQLPGFTAAPFGASNGATLALADIDADGVADLLAAAGPSASSDSTVIAFRYDGVSLLPLSGTFIAFPGSFYGVNVGAGGFGF